MISDYAIYEIGLMIFDGFSRREILKEHRIGTRTYQKFRDRILQSSLSLSEWQKLNPDQRRLFCYPEPGPKKEKEEGLAEVFENIYQRLNHRNGHYSIRSGWIQYKTDNPDSLQYSQFASRYRRWEDKVHPGRKATAPIQRQPGKYLYIDWIGDQPSLVRDEKNPARKVKAHFLVFTMGYSSKTFATAFPDEQTESVIQGINCALEYYGALPQALRPDNMKTAVISNTKDGIVLSTAMEDLQNYYDVPVLPARPRAPKDKATAERAVLILETELLPRLELTTFESFSSLNREVRIYIDDLNTRIKRDEGVSRNELFIRQDLPQMKALPRTFFTVPVYKKLKVQRNCHIKHDGIYYSVPYQYVGQTVIVKVSFRQIEICDCNNQSLCTHLIQTNRKDIYVTVPEHLKSCYQKSIQIQQRGIHYYIDWAASFGESMKELIQRIIRSCRYEEQSFGSCEGVLQAARHYPKEFSEAVAADCLLKGKVTYSSFKRNLEEKAEQENLTRRKKSRKETEQDKMPEHENIRGGDYYAK